jgi:Bacterial Ig-like domain (group 2)
VGSAAAAFLTVSENWGTLSWGLRVAVGNMTSIREHQTATLLNDGTVLEDGGTDGSNIFNTADIYTSSRLNGLSSIAITPSEPSIGTGAQQSFTAVGTFSDGSTQRLASVMWESSSSATATISGDDTNPGVANGLAQGTNTITASAAGVSGSDTLTVTAVITENLVCMPTLSTEENDRGGLEVAERRVLDRKAGSAKRNPVSAREEIALVTTTNGSYSRRSTD